MAPPSTPTVSAEPTPAHTAAAPGMHAMRYAIAQSASAKSAGSPYAGSPYAVAYAAPAAYTRSLPEPTAHFGGALKSPPYVVGLRSADSAGAGVCSAPYTVSESASRPYCFSVN